MTKVTAGPVRLETRAQLAGSGQLGLRGGRGYRGRHAPRLVFGC